MDSIIEDEIDDLSTANDFDDFMKNIEENMINMMKETAKAPSTALEHWNAFSTAIDWKEYWIRILIGFHIITATIVVLTRNHANIQTVLFLTLCIMTLLAERLNTYCANNWSLFSKQNYFDEHGVFASILYAGPLLLICLFQLLNFLRLASSALIKAKRMELKSKLNKKTSIAQ